MLNGTFFRRLVRFVLALLLCFPIYSVYSENVGSLTLFDFSEQERAYLGKKRLLKVCVDPDWMPYEKIDNGQYIGLTADYMDWFEQHLGIPIYLQPTSTFSESLQFVQTNQCDFISAVGETDEKSQYLNFSSSYFHSSIVIAADIHLPWITDLNSLKGKPLGVVRGYALGDFMRGMHPELTFIDVDSINDGLEKVVKGEIFGYVGTLATVGYHIQKGYFGSLKIAATLDGSWDLNIGVRKDEPILKTIFDKMIARLPEKEHQRILNNWVSVSSTQENPNKLNETEHGFLDKHPVIRFRTRPNRPPFEFFREGKAEGIVVDYIKSIAKIVGFTPEFVFDDHTVDWAHNMIENERTDFDTLLYSVSNQARSQRFNYGETFLSYPFMVMTHKDSDFILQMEDLNGKVVAMEKGFTTTDIIKKNHPNIKVVDAMSTAQALFMVEHGNADAYIGNLAIANYMIAFGLLENVKVAIPTGYQNIEFRFIAPKAWPELTSILSKGFRSMSPSQHSLIQQRWFALQTVERTDYRLVFIILLVSIIILSWFTWIYNRLSISKQKADSALAQLQLTQRALEKKNIELETLSVTDKLTGIYNRLKLEAVLNKEFERAKRYKGSFSVILVDLDHFKRVNDTLGHQAGDKVLKELAVLFCHNTRKVDTFGRWGGEEFLVICPHTDLLSTKHFAELLRVKLEEYDFGEIGTVTASFGVTSYQVGDSSIELLSRADIALYYSKKAGRNKVTAK